jgi:putative N-acetyltransferase (TIGR04045 family)
MFDGGIHQRVSGYRSSGIVTQVATEPWQVAAYHQLRRSVFVHEQGLFQETDADVVDGNALPIIALSSSHGMLDQVVGTVRIFRKPEDPAGTWYGGRLAVDACYRRHGQIGESLIRAAVCTAHALGCTVFLATVQPGVVRYFERHHFAVRGEQVVCGLPHALMQADLSRYPKCHFGQQPTILWADCASRTVQSVQQRAAAA